MKKAQKGNALVVGIEGVIDESVKWDDLLGPPPNPPVEMHLDCRKVTRINSMGVKGWIDYFRKVQAKRVAIHFWNCSQPIVQQINQIQNFSCGGQVHSLEASFSCEGCDNMFPAILKTQDLLVSNLDVPNQKCPKCGAEAEFDEIPAAYFKFLKR